MYQQPAQQTGSQTAFPSQQPAAGNPQGYGPPSQPIMYQMSPGQPQPALTGQPPMGQQGQPLQYYVPAGQPAGQPGIIQGAATQPPVDQEEDVTSIKIDIKYLKSGLNASRMMEFVSTALNCKGDHSLKNAHHLCDSYCFYLSITLNIYIICIQLNQGLREA